MTLDDTVARHHAQRLYGLELTNSGNADALDTVVNIVVQVGMVVHQAVDEFGTGLTQLVMHTTPEARKRYATFSVDVRPNIATRTYVAFDAHGIPLDETGPFTVRINATHPSAEPCVETFEIPRYS